MSSYSLHTTHPDVPLIEFDKTKVRYFIGGVRVSRSTYWDAVNTATRRDTFRTYRKRKLWHLCHVAYNPTLPSTLKRKLNKK